MTSRAAERSTDCRLFIRYCGAFAIFCCNNRARVQRLTPDNDGEGITVGYGMYEKLECVEQFCYLGDMIGAGGGAEDAWMIESKD